MSNNLKNTPLGSCPNLYYKEFRIEIKARFAFKACSLAIVLMDNLEENVTPTYEK